jgi:hypothetical protein
MTEKNVATAAGQIQDRQYTLPDTGAHALPTDVACKRVKLLAPVDSTGSGTNAAPVFFGDASNQRDWIAADGSRDGFVHIDTPAKIYVKGTAGDVINYRIEQ